MNKDAINAAVLATGRVSYDDRYAWVRTQCLYPSNDSVTVRVEGGNASFVVSDNGGAIEEASSSGVSVTEALRAIGRIASQQGLILSGTQIVSPVVSPEQLSAAIVLVANVSQEVAHWLLSHVRVRLPRNFKKALADLLERSFGEVELKHQIPIIGASNKAHKFEHVINLASGKRVLIDPVLNDASSINARVVANFDVKQANIDGLDQRIIYDDQDDWKSSDLSLLGMGATIVPFSAAAKVIERLKAA